ncbi:MAG: site-2 protease family protein [Patescibacteria group bacterium]|nr:site-2 protease family protein [Patescibacteria group bacterium]MDD5490185.1 site-2 protease family protein [Patescibacteria group bacterium]
MFYSLLLFFVIIIPSAIIHEYFHGWTADALGDPTAKRFGRLTLNPLAHIDPWGTFILPIILLLLSGGSFVFAYAKPVPFNPYNLKYPKWGPALVAIAGPLANLLVAIVFGLLVRFYPMNNFSLVLSVIVYANILLAVFNLVPLPPLDGSKILYVLLPSQWAERLYSLERYGMIIVLFFVFFAFEILSPIIWLIYGLIVGRPLLF